MGGRPGGAGEALFVDDVVYHSEDRLEGQERDNDKADDRVVGIDLIFLASTRELSRPRRHNLQSAPGMAIQQYKCRD